MRRKAVYLCIFLPVAFLCLWSCQQGSDKSSTTSQEKEVDSLILYARELQNSAPDSILFLSKQIIQKSKEINYVEGEIQGLFSKGIGYYLLGDDGEAEESCQMVLDRLNSLSSVDSFFYYKNTGRTYILQGIMEQRRGNYKNAISLELQALDHFEKTKDSTNIGTTYANISESFRFIGNFEKAFFYNERAEEIYVKEDMSERIPGILLNRGNILFDQKKYKASLELFKVVLEKANEKEDFRNMTVAINNIGACYERLGNFEKGLSYYLTSLEKYRELNDYWGEANTLGNISMVYYSMGKLKKAEEFAQQALAISKERHFLELERYGAENLAEILEEKGDYRRSLKFWKDVKVLQDSLYNQQKFETVSRLEKQFNEEKSKRVIAQKDRSIINADLQALRLRNIAIILGVFLLIVFFGAWLFYQQSKFRKEKNQELLLKNTIIQNQNEDFESLVNAYESQREKFIILGEHEIQLDEIIYIRYRDRVSSIFLKDQLVIEQRIQLSQLMAELTYKSHFLFSQINQNYIIHFKNVDILYSDDGDDNYYFTRYLPNDHDEYRDEDVIKTRKRSGLTKKFEREFQRYTRLETILS